jgi:hypothetical protein
VTSNNNPEHHGGSSSNRNIMKPIPKPPKKKPNRNSNQCSTMGQNQNLFENQRDWRREIWRVKKISNGKQSTSRSILSSHQKSTRENLMWNELLLGKEKMGIELGERLEYSLFSTSTDCYKNL